jgi:hypothetical protein
MEVGLGLAWGFSSLHDLSYRYTFWRNKFRRNNLRPVGGALGGSGGH